MSVLKELSAVIEARKGADPQSSYTASLYAQGIRKILEKVGEESTEVIIAAMDAAQGRESARSELVGEIADLWFHTLVLLSVSDLSLDDVEAELGRRFGISGLEEKAARQTDPGSSKQGS